MAGATDHSIRVTARGEFGELERGLKGLKRDLDGVVNTVDRGARRGGFFDQDQVRALDLFSKRFKRSVDELDKEFARQNNTIDRLHAKMKKLNDPIERSDTSKEISRREKELDLIRKKLLAMEKLNDQYKKEASGYTLRDNASSGKAGGSKKSDETGAMMGVMGALRPLGTIGKIAMGIAGIGGIMAILTQAYSNAHDRSVNSMDLAQRLRGSGRYGDARSMYMNAGNIGMRDRMGYEDRETWQFLDTYTQRGGMLNPDQQYKLQKFNRSYGLDLNTTGAMMGQARQLGVGSPARFTDDISGAVGFSGMTPRILEVMETSVGLLQTINTTLKDGDAKTALKYQAMLDRMGNQSGMTKLTGQQGAGLIAGLQGMFAPGNENNNHFTMMALQRYNPSKYGSMDYFSLDRSVSEGLDNPDVLPAWWQQIQTASGGNKDYQAKMLQMALQSGGYNVNAKKAYELTGVMGDITNKKELDSALQAINAGDGGAKYEERKGEKGQGVLDTEARFQRALADTGEGLLTMATTLKGEVTDFLNWMSPKLNDLMTAIDSWVDKITKKLGIEGSGLGIAEGILGAGMAAPYLKKGFGWLKGKFPGGTPPVTPSTVGEALEGAKRTGTQILDQYGRPLARSAASAGAAAGSSSIGVLGRLGAMGAGTLGALGTMGKIGLGAGAVGAPVLAGALASADMPKKIDGTIDSLMQLASEGRLSLDDLDDEGLRSLENLRQQGLLDFKHLDDYGVQEIADFGKSSKVQITALKKEGAESLLKFKNEGNATLKELPKVHRTILESLSDLWKKLRPSWLSGGSTAPSWGSVAYTEGYDVRSQSGITAGQLDDRLGGQLAGKGQSFVSAGSIYGIDPLVLAGIAMHETDNGGVMSGNSVGNRRNTDGSWMEFGSVEDSIQDLAKYLSKYYVDAGDTTLTQIGRDYAPSSEDPNNAYWASGVANRMGQFDIAPKNTFFRGWRDKVTSGYHTLGRPDHYGLDLGGEQGQILDALAGGTVKSVFNDPENSTAGGSSVTVNMGDGREYSYSHLSEISPDLQEGMQINRGQFIGRMGGNPGSPGSGYSTTGSHLHLGYKVNGDVQDPSELLSFMLGGAGDNGDRPNAMGDLGKNFAGSSSEIKVSVDVNLQGEGADKLNDMKHYELVALVQSIVENIAKSKVQLNPSMRM